ncbi:hypothetical protein INT45_012201 [Circinella minor]|uniref:Uncharacterized protein n=1 Tax=Circinella minor TaxID=1195481 RepID=A0A8H7VGV8_9FUNG|nr:hypothetical protein INT45_012201 [Circinella minor]
MLRSSSTALKSLQWRSPLVVLRHQSTATAAASAPPSSTPEAEQQQQQQQQQQPKEQNKKQPLSARLGGSGRGKTLEINDPFSQFLNNGQQRNKRMQQRGKPRTHGSSPGQFDDATTDSNTMTATSDEQQQRHKQQRHKRQNNNNNNNNNNRGQQQQDRPRRQEVSSSSSPNGDNNNRLQRQQKQKQQRQGGKNTTRKGGLENRRVTTFIDKDIDWTSMNTLEEIQENETLVGSIDNEQTTEDREKMMMELQTGDYERYFQVSKGMEFSPMINVDSMNSLMGGNASYGFDQKVAFLAAVSKASSTGVVAKK